MHVVDLIEFWARMKPHHPAIIQPDGIVTYRGLMDAIESVAHRVARIGLDPAVPVAVAIEHPAKQMAVCLGLLHAGFTTAPIFPGLMAHLRPAGIDNVVYEGEGQILSGGRNIRFDNSWLTAPPAPRAGPQPRPAGPLPSLIFFTSGSTGLPKKVVQTEESLIARMNICALTGDQNYARVLILPGLGSNFGFNRTCEVLREGKTACYALPGVGRLVLISTYGVDRIVASPQQALALVELCDANPGYQLDSVRMVRIGGAFASREVISRVQSGICRNIVTEYGSTEASLVAIGLQEMIAEIPDAVGFVGPWTEIEIVDGEGRPLPPGAEGHIRYRTPFFTLNYAANNPGATGDPARHWYYPGDLGFVTANGVLCIRGRGDDVINCGGHKVSAASLEEYVLRCRGIRDAGVCGIRSEAGVDEVWIGIVPTSEFQLPEFQRELERHDGFRAVLQTLGAEVVSVDAIPRSALGKTQRAELRNVLLARQQQPATPPN
jgi:acyl-coenzyme A synthetase/AMP-(fatty) acid ligase